MSQGTSESSPAQNRPKIKRCGLENFICDSPVASRVPTLSSRGAKRRGDLVPGATSVTSTRLPRCARNDSLGKVGTREGGIASRLPGLVDGQKPAPYQVRGDVICRIERMDRILGVSLPSNGPIRLIRLIRQILEIRLLTFFRWKVGGGWVFRGFGSFWVVVWKAGFSARGGLASPPGADLATRQGRIWQPARGGLSALRCQHTAGWGTQLFFPTFSCTQYAKGAPARGLGQSRRSSWSIMVRASSLIKALPLRPLRFGN